MLKLRLLAALLLTIATLCMMSSNFAGSARWIMVMTPERMVQNKLIHVRFMKPDGVALESDALEQMAIRELDCSTGHTFEMVKDYKMGFEPEHKLLGIYLLRQTWENKALCFSVPEIGKVEKRFSITDNNGLSIQLNIAP